MSKKNNLQKYRDLAQTITVGATVTTLVVWLLAMFTHAKSGSTLLLLQTALIIITAVGGVSMGVLYLIHLSSAKNK